MKLHRFIGKFNIVPGMIRISNQEIVNQIRNVLKLRIGESVILSDGNMNEGMAELIEFSNLSGQEGEIIFNIKEVHENKNEPQTHIILYCSILKKENFELVVQKATEVGVSMIVPIIAERTVKLNLRYDRLEKIIKEAAEQSGRGIVPKLDKINTFKDILSNKNDLNLLFDLSGQIFGPRRSEGPTRSVGIWIGPEGGWTDNEIETAKNVGFQIVSLGKLTFRAETAAIIGTFLSTNLLEAKS